MVRSKRHAAERNYLMEAHKEYWPHWMNLDRRGDCKRRKGKHNWRSKDRTIWKGDVLLEVVKSVLASVCGKNVAQ